MTSINDVFGSNETLKAADLQGREYPLTIASASPRNFDDGAKIVLEFQGADKKLICNWTNAQTIAEMFGDEIEGWVGQKVVLYPTKVPFQGKMVDAIRVKSPTVEAQAPIQNSGHPNAPEGQHTVGGVADNLNDDVPFAPEVR